MNFCASFFIFAVCFLISGAKVRLFFDICKFLRTNIRKILHFYCFLLIHTPEGVCKISGNKTRRNGAPGTAGAIRSMFKFSQKFVLKNGTYAKKAVPLQADNKKKRLLFYALQAGEQSEENESVLCLSKDPERGKHFYFSSAKVLLLFDICKFFRLFFRKKVDFYV